MGCEDFDDACVSIMVKENVRDNTVANNGDIKALDINWRAEAAVTTMVEPRDGWLETKVSPIINELGVFRRLKGGSSALGRYVMGRGSTIR
jgi:hypothetical protein